MRLLVVVMLLLSTQAVHAVPYSLLVEGFKKGDFVQRTASLAYIHGYMDALSTYEKTECVVKLLKRVKAVDIIAEMDKLKPAGVHKHTRPAHEVLVIVIQEVYCKEA